MTDSTSDTPAGWYPDATAPTGKRWWDGSGWTEHVEEYRPKPRYRPEPRTGLPVDQVTVHEPEPLPLPYESPAQTTGTAWIWLIVLMPIFGLLGFLLFDWKAFLRLADARGITGISSVPVGTAAGFLLYLMIESLLVVFTVVFAALDFRALQRLQVRKPFHWAFVFLGPIYVFGRSIVVYLRTGGGLAPLWVYLVVLAIATAAGVEIRLEIRAYEVLITGIG